MVDLHIHSVHSDGTDNVKEILKKANGLKLDAISITDHDSIEAYYEIRKNPSFLTLYSGKLITGSELLVRYKQTLVEVLAYGFDIDSLSINKVNEKSIQLDALKHLIYVSKSLGLELDSKDIKLVNNGAQSLAYYAFTSELLNRNLYNSLFGNSNNPLVDFYHNQYNNPNNPFYFNELSYYNDIHKVVSDIHKAGGIASLAHPFLYRVPNPCEFIEDILCNVSLDAIECEYPLFNYNDRDYLKRLCKKYNKYITGGSDYHGSQVRPNMLGTGIEHNLSIPYELVEKLIEPMDNVLSKKM